jgi:hypothetical protein
MVALSPVAERPTPACQRTEEEPDGANLSYIKS